MGAEYFQLIVADSRSSALLIGGRGGRGRCGSRLMLLVLLLLLLLHGSLLLFHEIGIDGRRNTVTRRRLGWCWWSAVDSLPHVRRGNHKGQQMRIYTAEWSPHHAHIDHVHESSGRDRGGQNLWWDLHAGRKLQTRKKLSRINNRKNRK